MRRCIGLDVHREFAEVAIWEEGVVRSAGQIKTTPEALRLFAESLCAYDEVALEATCNTHAIARLLERHVGRVVVSNPTKTRAIAEAKVAATRPARRALPPSEIATSQKSRWTSNPMKRITIPPHSLCTELGDEAGERHLRIRARGHIRASRRGGQVHQRARSP
jgi:hypothetical protein